jgi:hypothetical protein
MALRYTAELMNRAMLLQHLEQALRDVAQGEQQLVDHGGYMARLLRDGQPTTDAELLLRDLKESLATRLLVLIRLRGKLAALAG